MNLLMLYGVFAVAGIIALVAQYRSKHFVRCVLLTALQGIAALFAVNLIGDFIGIHLNINTFSLGVSGIFGTAGVVLMLLVESVIIR